MELSTITSADLKRLVNLIDQKETLVAEIARIDRELGAFGSSEPVAKANSKQAARSVRKPSAKGAKPGRRGHVKEAIVSLLKGAGKAGHSVKEIAAKLGAKDQNVYMWFSITGKKVKGIKKVGPGRYAWVG